MPEGLSASEVGKEIAEHREHAAAEHAVGEHAQRDRWVAIFEAVLLSVVALRSSVGHRRSTRPAVANS